MSGHTHNSDETDIECECASAVQRVEPQHYTRVRPEKAQPEPVDRYGPTLGRGSAGRADWVNSAVRQRYGYWQAAYREEGWSSPRSPAPMATERLDRRTGACREPTASGRRCQRCDPSGGGGIAAVVSDAPIAEHPRPRSVVAEAVHIRRYRQGGPAGPRNHAAAASLVPVRNQVSCWWPTTRGGDPAPPDQSARLLTGGHTGRSSRHLQPACRRSGNPSTAVTGARPSLDCVNT
jgi:hypothetical protein